VFGQSDLGTAARATDHGEFTSLRFFNSQAGKTFKFVQGRINGVRKIMDHTITMPLELLRQKKPAASR